MDGDSKHWQMSFGFRLRMLCEQFGLKLFDRLSKECIQGLGQDAVKNYLTPLPLKEQGLFL